MNGEKSQGRQKGRKEGGSSACDDRAGTGEGLEEAMDFPVSATDAMLHACAVVQWPTCET